MNPCVFCLEGGSPNRLLLHNVKCRCNYCFHMDCYTLYRTKTICPMCRAEVGDLYTEEVLPSAPMADATNRQNVQPTAVFVDTHVIDAAVAAEATATAANPRISAPQSRSQIVIHRILCSATLIFVLLVLMIILRAVTDKQNTD